ncbi:hypothetical protein [Candidatus Uabimicrobium sp. HlEnr_7]|uniref:hypothetical protein n=1 Tax=Candidatus Uabimicrobium helgolandensis TaxID=3095367 RepID=UPI00355649DE
MDMSRLLLPLPLEKLGKNRPPFLKKGEKILPNNIRQQVSIYQMVIDPQNADSVLTVSGNSNASANMSNNRSGIIDIRKFMESSTSKDYKIKILNNNTDQMITSGGIHARAILGTGKRPFSVWPLFIDKSNSITIIVDDLSGSSNSIRPCFECFKYYFNVFEHMAPSYRELLKKSSFFIYTTDDDVLLASSASDVKKAFITINSNHDFELKRITFHSDGDFLVRIASDDGRKDMTNGWVHSSCFGGDGEYFEDFEQSILLERTTKIQIEMKNLSGAANNVYFALSGIAYFMEL